MLEKLIEIVNQNDLNVFAIEAEIKGNRCSHYTCDPSTLHNSYSISKSVTAAAVGLLYDKKQIHPEDKIINYLQDFDFTKSDGKINDVQIRHLLTHTMGNEGGYLFEEDRYAHSTDDWVQFIIDQELPHRPGTAFRYSNSNFYLLSYIVEKIAGQTAYELLKQNLFAPMDITDTQWEHCPMGHTMGATGFQLKTADLFKFGKLYYNKGIWNGQQLLSREWIDLSVTPSIMMPEGPLGYGYGFFLETGNPQYKGRYHGAGRLNQLILVDNDREVIVAVNADYQKDGFAIYQVIMDNQIF